MSLCETFVSADTSVSGGVITERQKKLLFTDADT